MEGSGRGLMSDAIPAFTWPKSGWPLSEAIFGPETSPEAGVKLARRLR